MNPYDISVNYPIDRLTAVLGMASGSCAPVGAGFYSFISVPDEMLTDDDIKILSTFMMSEYYNDYGLVIFIKGNNRLPIVFDKEQDAIITATQQVPNLGKQLMFSVFRKTGVKFAMGAQVFQSQGV